MDNLPFFAVIATQAEGQTFIHDWFLRNEQFTTPNSTSCEPKHSRRSASILCKRSDKIEGTEIVAPPALRPSVIILIAMLAADGTFRSYEMSTI
jgi:UDP-N-acetylglucosamine 1-carboxyvinyltransferase